MLFQRTTSFNWWPIGEYIHVLWYFIWHLLSLVKYCLWSPLLIVSYQKEHWDGLPPVVIVNYRNRELQAVLRAIVWTPAQPARASEHHLLFIQYGAESMYYFRSGELLMLLYLFYLCMSTFSTERARVALKNGLKQVSFDPLLWY